MYSKIFLAASIALLISLAANAQTARQPFDDIGKEVKVLSLTNGKYEEFFDDDSLQRIGTALVNINTMKVVKLELTEEEERILDNSGSSRFLSVDPLSKNYPELTPYQFASNTPIQAIDLDGLEAFIVHGTTQTKTGVNFTNEAKEQLKRLTGNTVIDETFRWNATITNDMPMRKIAAQELVKHIVETRAKMIADKTITEDEPVSLIGYSHGGNVDIQAADMLYKQYHIKVNLVNVSTPAYNSWFGVDEDNWLFGNAEDPQGNKGINAMIHVIHENDRVWQAAKADMYYSDEDGKTKDYTILNNKQGVELNGPVESHTDLPSNPNLGKVLSVIPALPAAPKPTGLNKAIKPPM